MVVTCCWSVEWSLRIVSLFSVTDSRIQCCFLNNNNTAPRYDHQDYIYNCTFYTVTQPLKIANVGGMVFSL